MSDDLSEKRRERALKLVADSLKAKPGIDPEQLYFLDGQHKHNFFLLMEHFEPYMSNQYAVACYIVGVSRFYGPFTRQQDKSIPFDWAFDEYDDNMQPVMSIEFNELSSGERHLVRLGMHLYSGSNPFHLANAIYNWDQEYSKVFLSALHIYKNYRD